MTGKERVRRAIQFESPDRVPILYFNADQEKSDILIVDVCHNFMGKEKDTSEWGFKWERMDDTMGQPQNAPLSDWSRFASFRAPEIEAENRFMPARAALENIDGRYALASLQLSGFTIMSFLRGFETIMMDFALEPEKVHALARIVFGFENALLPHIKEAGFDGVAFYDDWGTQNNLIISPNQWREMMREYYQHQFDLASNLGLDVYFHTCGYVEPIIGDLIDAGVNILNLSQPNLYDMEKLGTDFGGKVCFVCPVSYQTTSITGTREDIFADVRKMVKCLGNFGGGLIGYVEEYSSIGLSDENYNSCAEAFLLLGQY